jgi:hypothetical protein
MNKDSPVNSPVWLKGAITAAILTIAPVVLAPPASAGPPCGRHNELIKTLAERFSERRGGVGLTPEGKMIEIFISEQGTWTILMSMPTGLSCMVAAGSDWQGKNLMLGPEI